MVPERGRVVLVPVSEVECLIAADNYVKAHTPGRVYLLRSKLSELTVRLDPADFARVHRSHAVALRHIREIRPRPSGEHDLLLASGREVRASRAYRKAVQSLMTQLATAPDR